MRLPRPSRNFNVHVKYGRYVAAKLTTDKREPLAADVTAVGKFVKDQGRAWEDAEEAEAGGIATRDAADEALDTACRELRLALASRGLGADREPPYTAIFPSGVSYYTAAPLDKNAKRYRELLARVEEHLPANDAARTAFAPTFPGLIEAFVQARTALDAARIDAGMARTALDASIDAWTVQMERTYGTLVEELGRRKAERFFRKTKSSTNDEDDDEDES